MLRRSQLYVPGNNEKMIVKSRALGSDSVILDLEDSVPAGEKVKARKLVVKAASGFDWGKRELCVRINSPSTPWGGADLRALSAIDRVDSFVLPKAEGDLSSINKSTGKLLIPIIESTSGLLGLEAVLGSRGVDAVAYGAADFALSAGGSVAGYLQNSYVKTKIVVAARAKAIDPIDNVFFDLKDIAGFRRQAQAARALGFVGTQLIHPSQIPVANQVFSPSRQEMAWANKITREYEKARGKKKGAFSLEGELIDEVHYKMAKRTLEAAACGP